MRAVAHPVRLVLLEALERHEPLTATGAAEQFRAEMWALISRYLSRLEDPSLRPPGSLPLEILLIAYPLDAANPEGRPDATAAGLP
jgi:hypothetical protein